MKDIRRHYSSSSSTTTTTNVQQQQRRCNNSGDGDDEQRRQRQSSVSVSSSVSSSSSMFISDNSMKPTKRTISVLFLFLGVTVATVLNFYYGLSVSTKFYNPVVDLYNDFEYMRKVTEVDNNANANPKQQQQPQSAKKKKKKKVPLQLSYIQEKELQKNHMFSDSWLLNRNRFLEIDSKQIYKIEDAALLPAWPRGKYDKVKHPYPHAKMLVDWTDFSVEHLSKWWGMLQIDTRRKDYEKADVLFPHVISFLDNYIQRRLLNNNMVSPSSSSSSSLPLLPPPTELENTIAMIAFMPYKRKKLTSYSLAASIVPLFNAGFSRLIIVGIQDNDHDYTREACGLLKSIVDDKNRNNNINNNNDGKNSTTDDLTILLNDNNNNNNNSNNNTIATIGYTTSSSTTKKNYKMRMEIAHVQIINKEWVRGEKAPGRKRVDTKSNIPRGAVIGMQKALMGKLDSNKERIEWLGDNHDLDYWKYIYLTEPDTILNLNHDLLPLFRNALDDGISLFPHRLHPLPHETDLPTNTTFNRGLYLPDYPPFSNVTTLDPLGDDYISCCDDGLSAPGKENWTMQGLKGVSSSTNDLNNICSSNRRWWECGFNEYDNNSIEEFNMTKIIQGHVRLLSYKMMRLQNGIGAVFGTNNQGRQCIPSKTSCDDKTNSNKAKEPK